MLAITLDLKPIILHKTKVYTYSRYIRNKLYMSNVSAVIKLDLYVRY